MAKDLEHLIETQVKRWEVSRRIAREGGEAARRALVHLDEGPWLTVSYQLGTDGDALAEIAGQRLGWQVYDREILQTIARETHTKEKIISRLDGHAVGHLNDLVRQLLVPDDMGQAGFLREMTRVVWALGHHGEAILLGRGANWILGPHFGLRVRLIAPTELRVARVAAQEGLPAADAERRVAEDDDQRRRFIRQAFGRQIDDPLGYDLVMNLERLAPEAAVETMVVALKRKLESQS